MAPGTSHAAVTPGTELWAKKISGTLNAEGNAIAVSPSGSTVFVTGTIDGVFATAAFSSSGSKLWVRTYDASPSDCCLDTGRAVAVAPDGATVFVTGYGQTVDGVVDQVTIAYDAGTGDELWNELYDRGSMDGNPDTGSQKDYASGLVVSPDGDTVYTAGEADEVIDDTIYTDYSALAYDAATGDLKWQKWYDAGVGGWDSARSIDDQPERIPPCTSRA